MKTFLVSFLIAIVALVSHPANAGERFAWDPASFDAALAKGGPVLVHVTAPWCGECKAQKPVVEKLAGEPDFSTLTIFDVDFDTQKDALRKLKVQKQSTLVVFKQGKEVGRAVGITRAPAIDSLVRKAL